MKQHSIHLVSALAVACGLALAGCQSGASDVAGSMVPGNAPACSVHLWDGGNFKDDDIVIKGPAEFRNLKNLPSSNGKDWDDEADSLKTGSGATVTIWEKKDFKGKSRTFGPGSEEADLDHEPRSLRIDCNPNGSSRS